MRSVSLALICLLGSVSLQERQKPPKTYSIPMPPKANFSSLDWLVGEWSGKTVAPSPPGQVRLSIVYDLDKQFIIFREEMTLQATPSVPAASESWLGVLAGRGSDGTYILRTFSSTGFITRYRASADEGEVRFTPEGGEVTPPGWLFRRVIVRTGTAELTESVQAAPPNESFFDYYTAKLSRATASSPPATSNGKASKNQ
jgi:hypothetical protein